MNLNNVSKTLSFFLRHAKKENSDDPEYISLTGGWADVDTIIDALRERYPSVDKNVLEEIVAADEKTRYSYDSSGKRIRANQGHSIPGVVIEMEKPEPPEFLYHGTSKRFLEQIMREGLKPMSRNYVHISPDYNTAVTVGKRHSRSEGSPVVLIVRARDFVRDGHELFISANGVWQAHEVPPEYLSVYEP